MNMIGHSANLLRIAAQRVKNTSKILVKTILPVAADERISLFGRENDMVKQFCVGSCHLDTSCALIDRTALLENLRKSFLGAPARGDTILIGITKPGAGACGASPRLRAQRASGAPLTKTQPINPSSIRSLPSRRETASAILDASRA